MYTNDYDKEYENNDYVETSNGSFWSNNKGIIIKLVIIAICVILLIWLVSALRKNNGKKEDVVYDNSVHTANVLKVRLAAEKYFFLDEHMPKENNYNEVSLNTLQNIGYVGEIIDANSKVCNDAASYAKLESTKTSYVLTIKLSCSTNDKEETYNYSKLDYACLNCDGETYMNGKNTNVDNTDNKENNNTNTNKNNNNNKDNQSKDNNDDYSCSNWSDWTTKKINDNSLETRTRTLVRGVKYGNTKEVVTYGPWTEFVSHEIIPNENVDVETITQVNKVWSENKTSDSKIVESDTVKLIAKEKVNNGTYTYCPDGYTKKDGKCYSKTIKGDLTYLQYNSGDYLISNRPCEAVHTEKDSNGKYVYMYKNCVYSKVTDVKKGTSTKKIYTYQELIDEVVTLYRARARYVNIEQTVDSYTEDYYEENKLPAGYVKLPGSERIEYSYKKSVCEK